MSNAAGKVMGTAEWLMLLGLSVLWGGSFFFSKVALGELPPFTVVFIRVALAATVLQLVVRATGHSMPTDPRRWRDFLVMGLLNNMVPFSLIFWGQTQIASGLASILNATTPLFTVVVAHFLTRDERFTANRLGGVVLGLIGVVIMIGPEALGGLGLNLLAQIACLGGALSYAFSGIWGKRFAGVPPLVTATGQLTASTVVMLPVAMLADRPWELAMPGMGSWLAMAGLALLSTAVAYILFFRILASSGATNVMLVTLLIPVSALLLGMTLLGERLDERHFAGMAMIGLGLAAMDGRLLARIASRPKAPTGPQAGDGSRRHPSSRSM